MRRGLLAVVLLAVAVPAGGGQEVHALRCGNDLVLPGDHVIIVHRKCGQPMRTTRLLNRDGLQVGHREVYERGLTAPAYVVEYRDERVVRIERLSRY